MNLALVPAAGRSTRLGRNKALLPLAGECVLDVVLDSLARGGVESSTVVVAQGDDALAGHCRGRAVAVAVNPRPELGMLSSIHRGLEAIEGRLRPDDALLVCPVDFPAVRSATVERLLAAIGDGLAPLAVPTHEGRRGHPLALSGSLAGDIHELDLAVGLRQLHSLHPCREIAVDDPGVLLDLDSWADYLELREREG